MTIIGMNQVIELNQKITEKELLFKLHMRDACGQQSFKLEPLGETTKEALNKVHEIIEDFMEKEKITIEYSKDGLNFWTLG